VDDARQDGSSCEEVTGIRDHREGTIPKRLRAYCLYRRRLLGEIARVAARTVTAAIRTLTGEPDLAMGIVACLQTHDTARLTEAFRTAALAASTLT